MAHDQLIICTFASANAVAEAEQALGLLEHSVTALRNHNIALLHRTADGGVEIRETAERSAASRDTVVGAVAGWLLGFANALVGGPLGPAQGGPIGQALGGQAAADSDSGFADPFLREIGASLQQGASALVLVTHADDAPAITAALAPLGGIVIERELTPELQAQLNG